MGRDKLYDLGLKYHTINSPGLVTLKEGPGELVRIVTNDNATPDVTLIYDDVDNTDVDQLIAVVVAPAGFPKTLVYKIPLKLGLTINGVANVGDTTIIYR